MKTRSSDSFDRHGRTPTGRFQPGVSGNPSGRPRLSESQRQARELRAQVQPELIERLLEIVRDPSAETRDVIACIKVLLDDPRPDEVEADDAREADRELIATLRRQAFMAEQRLKALTATATAGKEPQPC